jgi:hypothetical protein
MARAAWFVRYAGGYAYDTRRSDMGVLMTILLAVVVIAAIMWVVRRA